MKSINMSVISNQCNLCRRAGYFFIFFFIFIIPYSLNATVALKHNVLSKKAHVIVLDPGHGGQDTGARGPNGTFEKTVSLKLARIMADELGKTYKVVLTRTDDYGPEISDRTAVANNVKADLFISLHTGGSFLHEARGLTLYYYKKKAGSYVHDETNRLDSDENSSTKIPWNTIQFRHQTTSRVLAQFVLNRLKEQGIFLESGLKGASLVVLEGADMPAIAIETGYITNPVNEKELLDPVILKKITRGIHNGIDDFFKNVH